MFYKIETMLNGAPMSTGYGMKLGKRTYFIYWNRVLKKLGYGVSCDA